MEALLAVAKAARPKLLMLYHQPPGPNEAGLRYLTAGYDGRVVVARVVNDIVVLEEVPGVDGETTVRVVADIRSGLARVLARLRLPDADDGGRTPACCLTPYRTASSIGSWSHSSAALGR